MEGDSSAQRQLKQVVQLLESMYLEDVYKLDKPLPEKTELGRTYDVVRHYLELSRKQNPRLAEILVERGLSYANNFFILNSRKSVGR